MRRRNVLGQYTSLNQGSGESEFLNEAPSDEIDRRETKRSHRRTRLEEARQIVGDLSRDDLEELAELLQDYYMEDYRKERVVRVIHPSNMDRDSGSRPQDIRIVIAPRQAEISVNTNPKEMKSDYEKGIIVLDLHQLLQTHPDFPPCQFCGSRSMDGFSVCKEHKLKAVMKGD